MHFEDFLTQLGFGKREAKVYVALLEYGELCVSDVARKTKIHRVALYALLPQLKERGVVSIIVRGRRKFYVAENPEKLEVLFLQQQRHFEKNLKKLKKMYSRKKKRPVIKFREGQRGINDTYLDIVATLPKDATFYRYSSRKEHSINPDFTPEYFRRRDAKRLQRFAIVGEEKGRTKRKKLDRALKIIPKKQDLFDDDVSQIIYGDKVAFIDYENKISFIIESEKIATFQRKLFKMLYRRL